MNELRSNYRKNLKVSGTLVSKDSEIAFYTNNVSLSGFKACTTDTHPDFMPLEKDELVYVRLPMLNLEGVAAMVWKQTTEEGVFNFGFKFLNVRGVEGNVYRLERPALEELPP